MGMKKDDLISRSAAIKAVSDLYWMDERLLNFKKEIDAAFDNIKNLPAVDAVPVVHGRWVKVNGYYTPGGDPVWRCSECGKGQHVYGIEHGSYGADVADGQWVACPNCGAKMMEG